jgi:carbonic anhydrase
MKRIIFEIVLVLALAGAGAFGWLNYKSGNANNVKLTETTKQAETADKKIAELTESLEAAKQEIEPLKVKAQELDAVKAAMSSGEVLKDLEAAYKKEKSLSTERQLGLGALRLMTKGSKDPATVEAFKKALEMADWGSRKNVICAAQNALAAAGEKVDVLSECAGATTAKAAANDDKVDDHGKPAAKDGQGDKPEKAGKDAKTGKGTKHAAHWDYEGAMGPENWGKEFPTCARGKSQAPLNIKGPFEKALFAIAPDYKPGPLRIINNGHTIQVNVNPGSKLRIDSMPFELLQFHFHKPSEELIDGKPAAMVVHFVHKNSEGRLAVLGVLLKEGNENPGIKALWAHAPAKEGPEVQPDGVTFNPGNLVPRENEFYSYEGSLTTPPCTEGVRFFILKSQANISREQVEQFPFKKNARPVQPQNGRAIAG